LNWEAIGAVGELAAALGVIISLVYLAVQIRQNTRALRSTSYHQAAEQTWSSVLTMAQDPLLADLAIKRLAGGELSEADETRLAALDVALLFGYENMLRLNEQGLLDPDVWENVISNSMMYLGSTRVRELLSQRPGPLSARLLQEIQKHEALFPEEPGPLSPG
jgi:hypothetical protein